MARDLEARLTAVTVGPPDADALIEAVAARGHLDLAYDVVDTAVGRVLLAVTPAGLVRLGFAGTDPDTLLDDLARRVSPRILRGSKRLAPVVAELEGYLAGRRRGFDLPLDWRLAGDFQRAVLEAAAAIPYGQTATYADVAAAAGRPRAARAAGRALATNPLCVVVPCHRVVPAAGGVGGYAGGGDAKRRLLALESG